MWDANSLNLFGGEYAPRLDVAHVPERNTLFCPSQGVTRGQTIRIVVKWMEDHPEQLDLPGAILVQRSMREAFPCGNIQENSQNSASPEEGTSTTSAPSNAIEQHAMEQLRAATEMLKKCTASRTSLDGGGSKTVTAPMNVIWDIEQRQSIRSPEMGFIEFTRKEACSPGLQTETCRKNDWQCDSRNQAALIAFNATLRYCGNLKPNRYRYEFGLGTNGLEMERAVMKPDTGDNSPWVATPVEHGCVEDAVLSVSKRPAPSEQNP